jgi:hypothetical protein
MKLKDTNLVPMGQKTEEHMGNQMLGGSSPTGETCELAL